MEVLMGSDDIGGDLAQAYGYVNSSLPDVELDRFVEALATRIASFDKWAISNAKRLVNAASLTPEVEMAAGWEACIASLRSPGRQRRPGSGPSASWGFINRETQKIAWDSTWDNSTAEPGAK
jgi:enoyl-CoA hydratase/carnithine racemase